MQGGDDMFVALIEVIIAPALVGVIIALFSYWLDKRDD